MANNTLSVENICYCYEKGNEILHSVSAQFSRGKITALIGANGCGKSTLLNLIAGVHKPDKGKVLINGNDIRKMKRVDVAKCISVVHQSNTSPSDMTVKKLVSAGRTPYIKMFKPFSQEDEQTVLQALKDTETLKYADREVSTLSGGQMQRVWLAMALAQQTDILLLDEITTYLDIHYQLEILHLIKELNKRKNITIVMVLHDINLALEFCDEIVVMKDGNILAQGQTKEAINEKILNEAFAVSSQLLKINGNKYCIFSRKGEADE